MYIDSMYSIYMQSIHICSRVFQIAVGDGREGWGKFPHQWGEIKNYTGREIFTK